ncbi:hypothetical protein HPP92_018313 [Vanilla planifolia]|uniref:Uncharacterized protein n=1 Tax=Vanilla planifolia TaxID=51239 RepID=A0A835Q7Y1_VANPL|nr:hypothetical protein HPP92_018939 [Vanilla planifolia]KAG0468985.1 hypothetical protein HPP92_018313 [Vanilla planifolia]
MEEKLEVKARYKKILQRLERLEQQQATSRKELKFFPVLPLNPILESGQRGQSCLLWVESRERANGA